MLRPGKRKKEQKRSAAKQQKPTCRGPLASELGWDLTTKPLFNAIPGIQEFAGRADAWNHWNDAIADFFFTE